MSQISSAPWSWWLAWGWLSTVLLAALLAPTAIPSPDLLHLSHAPALPVHWLGTTSQGIDVGLSMLQGARTVVLVSLPAAISTLLIGSILGTLAGFVQNTRWRLPLSQVVAVSVWLGTGTGIGPRWVVAQLVLLPALATVLWWLSNRWAWGRRRVAVPVDSLLLGAMALLDSVPLLVLVLTMAAIRQPSLGGLVGLLTLTCWTTAARLMRAATLQVSALPYVAAATAAGLPAGRLIRRHIWPNTWHVVRVRFPLTVALLIGFETTLSFLGVGLPPEVASWGRLLAGIRQSPTDWWVLAAPGGALVCTLLSLQALARPMKGSK